MSNDAIQVAKEAKKELDERFRGSDEAQELSALLCSPHIQVLLYKDQIMCHCFTAEQEGFSIILGIIQLGVQCNEVDLIPIHSLRGVFYELWRYGEIEQN